MPPKIIFVEGNIGTGKTTFLNLVQKHVDNVQCILEPVDKWTGLSDSSGKNILHYFYENMEKYTYSFQSYAFLSRVMLLDLIDYSKEYIFIERSVYSDKNIFAQNCVQNGTMTEIEWNLYNKWFDWMVGKLIKLDYTHIYLKCQPEVSYARLKTRNRPEEQGISLDYITQIHQRHEDWLGNSDCIVLDASVDYRTNPELIMNYIDKCTPNTKTKVTYDLNYIV
jgi:deoxyadenosine/deoxycytidine kinase